MLKITVNDAELFDESKNEFVTPIFAVMELEHSLASISNWESKWKVPFLSKEDKSQEQVKDYVRMMLLNDVEDFDLAYSKLSESNVQEIQDLIADSSTATWFSDDDKKKKDTGEIITSEVIYYWMVSLGIPFECQHWHLNKLIALIKVCNEMNKKEEKKTTTRESLAQRKAMNAQRRAKLNSKG